ncbi:MAG: hypothetical protein NZ828_07825 [Alphaproteobacteria bacterium]|nr:hypothetical protein [Alphaproteobacteria bacterium]
MSGNLAFYFYTASLDLHAQDAQVFIADFATSGHVAASADTFKMKGSDVFHEVEDTQIPAAVLKRHGANGAEAAYFMARDAYNHDITNLSARNKLGLAITADVQNVYIAFARASAKGYARNPDINLYQYPRGESDVAQQAAAEAANILFNYACRGYVAPAHVVPVQKLPCPEINRVA